MITPVQEEVFLQFVGYRTIVISNLSRSLTMLDHVEITNYEISMIQEMANKEDTNPTHHGQLLTFHEQPSFTRETHFQSQYEDFKMPHNFFRANAHCPSPIKRVPDEDCLSIPANSQSFIARKTNLSVMNASDIYNKNNSFIEQDSFLYAKNSPVFQNIEINKPPTHTKSQHYVDQNSSAVFARPELYSSVDQRKSYKNMGTPNTISKEQESIYKRSFPDTGAKAYASVNDSTTGSIRNTNIKNSYYTPERTNLMNICNFSI